MKSLDKVLRNDLHLSHGENTERWELSWEDVLGDYSFQDYDHFYVKILFYSSEVIVQNIDVHWEQIWQTFLLCLVFSRVMCKSGCQRGNLEAQRCIWIADRNLLSIQ